MTGVVITGIGVVSAFGDGRARLSSGLRAGLSPAVELTGPEWAGTRARLAVRAADFLPAGYVPPRWKGRVGRHGAFAIACARMAVADAGLRPEDVAGSLTGVVMACNFGGSPDGTGPPNALHVARTAPWTAAAWISMDLGTMGPGLVLGSASCAGAQSVSLATMALRSGRVRRALAGGVEAPLAPAVVQALDATGILSRRNHEPARALRPFDRARDGTVIGEGGAVLLLETEKDALRRGARILARIAGAGDAMEAHHPYAPSPDGRAARAALDMALRDAGLRGRDIDLVVAHGTGTRQNDAYESDVITSAIGPEVAVTAVKPLTGHLLGAAGAMDVAAIVTAASDGFVPPIANCDEPDGVGTLDLVRGSAREEAPRTLAVLSHGLGGFSCCLVLSRP